MSLEILSQIFCYYPCGCGTCRYLRPIPSYTNMEVPQGINGRMQSPQLARELAQLSCMSAANIAWEIEWNEVYQVYPLVIQHFAMERGRFIDNLPIKRWFSMVVLWKRITIYIPFITPVAWPRRRWSANRWRTCHGRLPGQAGQGIPTLRCQHGNWTSATLRTEAFIGKSAINGYWKIIYIKWV